MRLEGKHQATKMRPNEKKGVGYFFFQSEISSKPFSISGVPLSETRNKKVKSKKSHIKKISYEYIL
jgi:hypothetical protein